VAAIFFLEAKEPTLKASIWAARARRAVLTFASKSPDGEKTTFIIVLDNDSCLIATILKLLRRRYIVDPAPTADVLGRDLECGSAAGDEHAAGVSRVAASGAKRPFTKTAMRPA
jgi:hypothetical protein